MTLPFTIRGASVQLLPVIHDLPDDVAKLVGKAIATWAHVEWLVRGAVYIAAGVSSKQGRIAIRDPRLDDQITMLEQLLSLKKIKIKSDLRVIQRGLRELSGHRDLLAHGIWMRDEKGKLLIQRISGTWSATRDKPKVSKRIDPEGIAMDVDGLETLLGLMQQTIILVEAMFADVRDAVAESNKKSPQF